MTIEMVAPFFSYAPPQGRQLVQKLRTAFFDGSAKGAAGNYIFTYVRAFGTPGEKEYIQSVADKFEGSGHRIHGIEFIASQAERSRHTNTKNRLRHKATKRDTSRSENNLLETNHNCCSTFHKGETAQGKNVRTDTTDLSAEDVATQICPHQKTSA